MTIVPHFLLRILPYVLCITLLLPIAWLPMHFNPPFIRCQTLLPCILPTDRCYAHGAGILQNAESCQGLIRGKSSAERSANYPLSLFPHSAAEKFRISMHCKTNVCWHCTTDVQPMHRSVRCPTVPSFCILCGPFAKEQGSFYSFY